MILWFVGIVKVYFINCSNRHHGIIKVQPYTLHFFFAPNQKNHILKLCCAKDVSVTNAQFVSHIFTGLSLQFVQPLPMLCKQQRALCSLPEQRKKKQHSQGPHTGTSPPCIHILSSVLLAYPPPPSEHCESPLHHLCSFSNVTFQRVSAIL